MYCWLEMENLSTAAFTQGAEINAARPFNNELHRGTYLNVDKNMFKYFEAVLVVCVYISHQNL